jgi:hypothetical protein
VRTPPILMACTHTPSAICLHCAGRIVEGYRTKVEQLEAEKAILRTELAESEAFLETIQRALNGEEPSDFMRSFTSVEHAWQIFRLAYPPKMHPGDYLKPRD